jgi:rhamnopyranosyl-N-acetylglucosaminyl-diphospho-decaprenol beta-1,3/1,4-galactofuranosyltransferase
MAVQQPTRVLAYIHTFNDSQVIEQALDALRRQTRPPDAIVIVDNASTDETLHRTFTETVTVIRNLENLGTSGAVRVGFTHALKEKFDWTWVLDPDSVPEPDALANLLAFFERLPPAEQEKVCFLACRLAPGSGEADYRPIVLTRSGVERILLDADTGDCRCDCFLWSGSLFRMPAVTMIGLPSVDYFTDLSELEYGYRARQLGLTGYIVSSGVLHQDVGRRPGVATRTLRFGPFSFRLFELSPLRCYYHVRNTLYFWLYQCRPYRPRWVFRSIVHALFFPRTFAVRPHSHGRHLIACLRGAWDGLTGHMERRY